MKLKNAQTCGQFGQVEVCRHLDEIRDAILGSKKSMAQHIGTALRLVIDRLGLRQGIDEARIVEAWSVIAGPQINSVTDQSWVKSGTLYVRLTSAIWRQELHLRHSEWLGRLNRELGSEAVKAIRFC